MGLRIQTLFVTVDFGGRLAHGFSEAVGQEIGVRKVSLPRLAEEKRAGIESELPAVARAGEPRGLDELVVFKKAQEDAPEQPSRADLGDGLIQPRAPRGGGALLLLRVFVEGVR